MGMDVVEHRGAHRFGLAIGTAIAGISICIITRIATALGAACAENPESNFLHLRKVPTVVPCDNSFVFAQLPNMMSMLSIRYMNSVNHLRVMKSTSKFLRTSWLQGYLPWAQ